MTHRDYIPAIRPWSAPAATTWAPPAEPTTMRGDQIDVDWIAVERLLAGDIDPVFTAAKERMEAAGLMYRFDVPIEEIARRLKVAPYTAKELLAAAGVLPPELLCVVDSCWHARSGHGLCKKHMEFEKKQIIQSGLAVEAPKCGTYGGYRHHQKYGTPIDDACRDAYTAGRADERQRADQRKAVAA